MLESLRQKNVVTFDTISTIGDGIGVRIPIPECVRDMEGVIDDGIFEKDASLIEAMRLAHKYLGIVSNRQRGQTAVASLRSGRLSEASDYYFFAVRMA